MNYFHKKSVEDVDVQGKHVLVRCDFNVPLDENGNITDTGRIDSSMLTIRYLLDRHAKVILCSHMGRPKASTIPNIRWPRLPCICPRYWARRLKWQTTLSASTPNPWLPPSRRPGHAAGKRAVLPRGRRK